MFRASRTVYRVPRWRWLVRRTRVYLCARSALHSSLHQATSLQHIVYAFRICALVSKRVPKPSSQEKPEGLTKITARGP